MGDDAALLDTNSVRHGDTVLAETDHQARIATMSDFYRAYPLDRNDIPKMLVNPVTGGQYMQSLIAARNRKIDDTIFNALLNNIVSFDGQTTYSLPAAQIIAAGGTGLTKAKIIQARSIFRANETDGVDGDEETTRRPPQPRGGRQ
jgi:hypothetical protein